MPGPRRLMKTERKLTLGTNMSGAVTDYFRNREANSLANKRTRLLLQGCPHMSWVLAWCVIRWCELQDFLADFFTAMAGNKAGDRNQGPYV